MFNKPRRKFKSYDLELEEAELLFKKYPECRKMFQTIEHIKSRNPRIRKLFNRRPVELSIHDTKALIRIIELQNEIMIREREIFKRIGARRSIAYLKELEELKDERNKLS